MKHNYFPFRSMAALMFLWLPISFAHADQDAANIRTELDALKTEYEARIQALEQRLDAAESAQHSQQQPASSAQQFDQQQPALSAPPPNIDYAAVSPGPAASASAFNPAIGVILNGAFRAYDKDPEDYYIPGFPAGGESGLGPEGFSIGESELVMSANVDDWFYAQLTAAIEQEDDGQFNTSLEEAYVDTLAMPANLSLRFGRFFSSVGYLNNKHSHTWTFSNQALPYSALLGIQYGDDGMQLRWLAPIDLYLELGAEVFRGNSYPAAGDADNGMGTQTVFVKVGDDVGLSNSWSAGFSWLGAKAQDRSAGDEDDPLHFDGDSDIYIADFIWKWAPNGNPSVRNLTFQSEYLWRNENGSYLLPGISNPESVNDDASGWYAQLVYQWRPRWRSGLRIDGLDLDNPGSQFAGTQLDTLDNSPLRYTLMFDYSNSEFSLVRLQFERDQSGQENNNALTLQYIVSFGAHGAHEF